MPGPGSHGAMHVYGSPLSGRVYLCQGLDSVELYLHMVGSPSLMIRCVSCFMTGWWRGGRSGYPGVRAGARTWIPSINPNPDCRSKLTGWNKWGMGLEIETSLSQVSESLGVGLAWCLGALP